MIERTINEMVDSSDLYYIGDDCWQASQSVIDEGKAISRHLKGGRSKRSVKRDDRSFHGKVSNDKFRKDAHHGSSIGAPRK